jgi:hypothetical protein
MCEVFIHGLGRGIAERAGPTTSPQLLESRRLIVPADLDRRGIVRRLPVLRELVDRRRVVQRLALGVGERLAVERADDRDGIGLVVLGQGRLEFLAARLGDLRPLPASAALGEARCSRATARARRCAGSAAIAARRAGEVGDEGGGEGNDVPLLVEVQDARAGLDLSP